MKLIVNVGSTSVKSQLFDDNLNIKATLNADYGATDGLSINGVNVQGEKFSHLDPAIHDAKNTLAFLYNEWRHWLAENQLDLSAIGHRVVHGGATFKKITLITTDVLSQIAQLDNYAPLHNPPNRLGIEMAEELFANVPQFAVFDTAFHRQIPDYAGRYAIPEKLSANVDFYRYGFHGISCQHSVNAAAKLLNKSPADLNVIILHLGGGASATVVKNGVSVDTSMGFSPTEGLVMASRCGDIDPMIAITLQREGRTIEDINRLLNKQSGLQGVCGETDMRTILTKAEHGDESCHIALNLFCYRVKKYVGAYFAVLNGNVDALIFTGGIGENAPAIRQQILDDLNGLGFSLNSDLNQQRFSSNIDISDHSGRSRIFVIHAEEEREIAQQIQFF
ncbi:MAG: acetate/propionate family kinase [Methylococcales bacterium]|nr:acetate/propionate family kinase [Methylococcales bacterium]MDD5755150.1 acetate/propionate family kinase [Methylococcales bacterium]